MGFPRFEDGTSEYQEFYLPRPEGQPDETRAEHRNVFALFSFVLFGLIASFLWMDSQAQSAEQLVDTTENTVLTDAGRELEPQRKLSWTDTLSSTSIENTVVTAAEPLVVVPLSELETLKRERDATLDAIQFEQMIVQADVNAVESEDEAPAVTAAVETLVDIVDLKAFDCVSELQTIAGLSTIYFESGSSEIDGNGTNLLRRVGHALENCPDAIIQVSGHSDSSGSDQANLNLSWERAENTISKLVELDMDASKFEPVGFGARSPSSEGGSSELDRDRRVEFKVLLEPFSN